MTDTANELIAQARKLDEAATPAPWTFDGRDILRVPLQNHGFNIVVPLPETWHESQEVNKEDAAFIAESRALVIALADALEAAEAENARLQEPPAPVLAASWDCATSGHLVTGIGTGTGLDTVVWNERCERCGALVSMAAVPGDPEVCP